MLNAPFTTHFDKAPHMDIPLKMKKTPTPLQLQVLLHSLWGWTLFGGYESINLYL